MIIISRLKMLHYGCRFLLDTKDYEGLCNLLGDYAKEGEINELKMILVVTQSLKNNDILNRMLVSIEDRYRLLYDIAMIKAKEKS
jgi:hypothetical protein